jgi:N-dimethylarginine dimethylaminohydrolase
VRVEEQAPHLLMCPPDFFEVAYVINPWMNPAQWALDAKQLSREAVVGWKALKSLYQRLGAQVTIQPPAPGLPDLVFTANCAVVLDGKAVLARFLNDERRGEEVHDQRVFEQLRARGVIDEFHRTPPGVYFEGVGDALFDPQRRLMWMGFGQRSSRCAHHTMNSSSGLRPCRWSWWTRATTT